MLFLTLSTCCYNPWVKQWSSLLLSNISNTLQELFTNASQLACVVFQWGQKREKREKKKSQPTSSDEN